MPPTELDNKMRSLYRDALNITDLTRGATWNWIELEKVVERIGVTVRRTPFRPKSASKEMLSVIRELSIAFASARRNHTTRQKGLIRQKTLRLTELIEGITAGETKQIELRSILKEVSSVFIDAALMLASDRQDISPELVILSQARMRVGRQLPVDAGKGSAKHTAIDDLSSHETAPPPGPTTQPRLTPEEEGLLLVGSSALMHYVWLERDLTNTTTLTKGRNPSQELLEIQTKLRQRWDWWMIHHTVRYLRSKNSLSPSQITPKERLELDFNRFLWSLVYYETELVELTDRQKLDQGDQLLVESIRIAKRRIARLRKSIRDTSEAMAGS